MVEKAVNNGGHAMCAMLEIPLKPLNLHERVSALTTQEMEQLPLSRIVITGRFSQSDALQWVSNCIPSVPTVIGENQSSTLTYFFKSSFTRTYLIVEIEDESIAVQSDNFSVITIVKDQISQYASQRKLHVDIQSELNQESIPHLLHILNPMV